MSSNLDATPGVMIPGAADPGLPLNLVNGTVVFKAGILKLRWNAGALTKYWDSPDE